MIKTKYNFKQHMARKYPDIAFVPVYGTSAYVFNKELEPIDMYEYNVQQLTNGQYVVFIGINDFSYIEAALKQLNTMGTISGHRPPALFAPTTFSTFEKYLAQVDVKPIHRTHIQASTANEALFQNSEEPGWNVRRNWYMYELEKDAIKPNPTTPRIDTENGTMVLLIKAASSNYVSKKTLFKQKFALMMPLYDQAVAACATQEWDTATDLVNQYASIQFDQALVIKNIEAMKEAFENGTFRLFVRNLENFEVEAGDEVL